MLADPALTVTLLPGFAALSGVMSVLHARAAEVRELTYTSEHDSTVLHLRLIATPEQAQRVAIQINRRADVFDAIVYQTPFARNCCGDVGVMAQFGSKNFSGQDEGIVAGRCLTRPHAEDACS